MWRHRRPRALLNWVKFSLWVRSTHWTRPIAVSCWVVVASLNFKTSNRTISQALKRAHGWNTWTRGKTLSIFLKRTSDSNSRSIAQNVGESNLEAILRKDVHAKVTRQMYSWAQQTQNERRPQFSARTPYQPNSAPHGGTFRHEKAISFNKTVTSSNSLQQQEREWKTWRAALDQNGLRPSSANQRKLQQFMLAELGRWRCPQSCAMNLAANAWIHYTARQRVSNMCVLCRNMERDNPKVFWLCEHSRILLSWSMTMHHHRNILDWCGGCERSQSARLLPRRVLNFAHRTLFFCPVVPCQLSHAYLIGHLDTLIWRMRALQHVEWLRHKNHVHHHSHKGDAVSSLLWDTRTCLGTTCAALNERDVMGVATFSTASAGTDENIHIFSENGGIMSRVKSDSWIAVV